MRITSLSAVFGFLLSAALISLVEGANFAKLFDVVWGGSHSTFLNNGTVLSISLDKASGGLVQSKDQFLFGKLDMQIKLVRGESAGTVVSVYLRSGGNAGWDEIDFEFLGNVSGQPYLLHTNIYTQGKGDREQQYKFWFDPTAKSHIYSILWNPSIVLWYVDGVPIRVFKNSNSNGVQYPMKQPMKVSASIWNGEEWATRGGAVKTDWTKSPFIVSFNSYKMTGCIIRANGASSCNSTSTLPWYNQQLDLYTAQRIQSFQSSSMVYNYCSDTKRFNGNVPRECSIPI